MNGNVMNAQPQNYFLENKVFAASLLGSLLLHLCLMLRFANAPLHESKKNPKPVEVVYYRTKAEKPEIPKPEETKEVKTLKEEKLQDSRVLLKKMVDSPIVRDMKKMTTTSKIAEKPAQMDRLPVERHITVPPVKSEKINNPVYLNYYQQVRSRIRDQAYQNYTEYESGEVYLTFVLQNDGTLKQLKLIEEKTSANSQLRQIGMKSIKDSNPFPSFPADLKYPELSFNVVISFEVKAQ